MSPEDAGEGRVSVEDAEPAERLTGLLARPVRERLLALVAAALGDLPPEQVPAPLERVARFAPAKRARLAAAPLAAALESDAVFRGRMSELVATALPGLVEGVREGSPPPAADPLDVAALAYLDRPAGWTEVVQRCSEQLAVGDQGSAADQHRAERLESLLLAERASARTDRDRLKTDLSALKDENATLRRRIHELRPRLRAAEADAEAARAAAALVEQRGEAALASAEVDARRLRSRLGELEGQLDTVRRAGRSDRAVASSVQRILLDTVLDAAAGLRRELALPPVTVRPADDVAGYAPAEETAAARALDEEDPATVDAVLTLPGLHLVIDGYNVTRLLWDAQPLEVQRRRLVGELGSLVARTRAEVTVVFDGAELAAPPQLGAPRGVRVMFSPEGTTADEVVRRLVAAEPQGRPVLVVSTDREVVAGVRRSGARTLSSAGFLRRLSLR